MSNPALHYFTSHLPRVGSVIVAVDRDGASHSIWWRHDPHGDLPPHTDLVCWAYIPQEQADLERARLIRAATRPEPPPRERSEVPADTDTSEPETASERHSGGFTGKDIGSTSSIDVTSDRFIVVRFNGQQLGPINGDAVRRLDDLCHWLTSYVEECRESRDAAADDGDYESALRHRTRVEVLEDVLGRIGNGDG